MFIVQEYCFILILTFPSYEYYHPYKYVFMSSIYMYIYMCVYNINVQFHMFKLK